MGSDGVESLLHNRFRAVLRQPQTWHRSDGFTTLDPLATNKENCICIRVHPEFLIGVT